MGSKAFEIKPISYNYSSSAYTSCVFSVSVNGSAFLRFQLGHSRQHSVAADCHAFYYIAASDRKVVESNVPKIDDKIPPKSS